MIVAAALALAGIGVLIGVGLHHASQVQKQRAFAAVCREAFASVEKAGEVWSESSISFENTDAVAKHLLKRAQDLAPDEKRKKAASCLGNYLSVLEIGRDSYLIGGGNYRISQGMLSSIVSTHVQSMGCLEETQR